MQDKVMSSDLESNNQLDDKNFNNPIQIRIDYSEVPNNQDESIKQNKIKKKSSYKGTLLTLYKAYVGSGVLALPYSFYHGGLLLSSFIYVLLSLLINYQQVYLIILAEDARKTEPNLNYCKLVQVTLGNFWKNVCQFFLALMQWGCCISYVIFFIEFFDYAIFNQGPATIEHQLAYLAIAFLIILPMTLITNMALFTKVSAFSNVLLIFALSAICISALEAVINRKGDGETKLANFSNISTTIGVGIFAFEAVGIILNVQSSMQKKEKFSRLLQLVTGTVVILSILFSILCSIGFGLDIKQIVLFNLPDSPLMSIVQVCYAVALILSFPLQLLPAFDIVEDIGIIKTYINSDLSTYVIKRTGVRVIQVLIIGFIALAIPQFAIFVSFLGGVAGSSLQFFFPLMIYLRKLYAINPQRDNILYCGAMTLGMILGAYATINSFIKMVSD